MRLIAATNRNSPAVGRALQPGSYHRLSVFPIRLPPLRERRVRAPAAAQFLHALAERERKHVRASTRRPSLLEGTMARQRAELRNEIHRAVIRAETARAYPDLLTPTLSAGTPRNRAPSDRPLRELQREVLPHAIADRLRRYATTEPSPPAASASARVVWA